jgi:AP endonuclease-2
LVDHFTPEQLDELDAEGRVVITHHYKNESDDNDDKGQPSSSYTSPYSPSSNYTGFVLFNIYAPAITNEQTATVRMQYKLNFYKALQLRWTHFIQQGIPVIVVGDMNIAPAPIDYPDPESEELFYRRDRPDRLWLRNLLSPPPPPLPLPSSTTGQEDKEGTLSLDNNNNNNNIIPCFKDIFRIFHPDRRHAFTVWNTQTNSRVFNYGSRIDLVLVAGLEARRGSIKGDDDDVLPPPTSPPPTTTNKNNRKKKRNIWISGSDIQPSIEGSDHCPIWVDISWKRGGGMKFPCAGNVPKTAARWTLGGRQTKVKDFLMMGGVRKRKMTCDDGEGEEEYDVVVVQKSGSGSKMIGGGGGGGGVKQQQGSIKSWFTKSNSNKTIPPLPDDGDAAVEDKCQDTAALDTTTPATVSTFVAEELAAATKLRQEEAKAAWQHIHTKMISVPKCLHNEDAVLKKVNKSGANKGRFFYTCGRAEGPKPEGKCDYFKWVNSSSTGGGASGSFKK